MNRHIKKSLTSWTERMAQSHIEKIQTLEETLALAKSAKRKKQIQEALDKNCDRVEKLINVVISDSISSNIH